jgi:hypothetical protein
MAGASAAEDSSLASELFSAVSAASFDEEASSFEVSFLDEEVSNFEVSYFGVSSFEAASRSAFLAAFA